jgi:molybdenum-dependent DNA-binding transcriptional regulator ModE
MAAHDQVHADLTAHPVMGLKANTEDYHVETVEDMGIAAKDAGIGWKTAMAAEGTLVEASAIDTVADATQGRATSPHELRQMLQMVLRQMGVRAEIQIQPIAGPSEVHIREQTST